MKTNEEVNQILAEFMGIKFVSYPVYDCPKMMNIKNDTVLAYTDSLDACVPIMEKLKLEINNTCFHEGKWMVVFNWIEKGKGNPILNWTKGNTLQEVTAHALVEAIEELKNKSKK